ETIHKTKLKEAHKKVLSSSNIINTTNNNNLQQSLSDKSSSSTESSNENWSSLINKQITSTTLPHRGFWSVPPMNESDYLADDDNNDTQQFFNTIEDNNNNNTQPFNAIEDNNNNIQQYSGKKIIEVDDNNDTQQYS
ncbi:12066_t:CDS:2, partial [Cetraspora pellucida]